MTHFYYRAEVEKASEESLTLPNGEFANKIGCTEQAYALISKQSVDWCFEIWTMHTRQVETLRPESCIVRGGKLFAYYYEAAPCVIFLEDTDKVYTIHTEDETRIDSHDRKPYTETIYTKLRPCRLTKEGFAIRDMALFWCRKSAKGALIIPNGVEEITNYAFEDCRQITGITIPASTKRIDSKAFRNCSGLTSVTLPDKVYIARDAFEGCSAITQIQVDGIASIDWQVFRHTAFWKDPVNRTHGGLYLGNCLVDVDTAAVGEYTVLPGTEAILDAAFKECKKLTSISLPQTVQVIGKRAFEKCTLLTQITIPSAVTKIEPSVFSGCVSLHTVTLPEKARSIGEFAFCGCKSLMDIRLPEGLEELSYDAFSGCGKLQSISLPSSLRMIGASVFDPDQTENVFKNCLSLDAVTVQPGTYAYRYVRRHRLGQFGQVTIPEGQETIEQYAFTKTALKAIIFPQSLQVIGPYAFEECYRLETVALPEGTTKIQVAAFRYCRQLSVAFIPDSVMKIESFAFHGCENIVIHCHPGSYAEHYAQQEGLSIQYIPI